MGLTYYLDDLAMFGWDLDAKKYDAKTNNSTVDQLHHDRMLIITNDKWFKLKVEETRKQFKINKSGLEASYEYLTRWSGENCKDVTDKDYPFFCISQNKKGWDVFIPKLFVAVLDSVIAHYGLSHNFKNCIAYYIVFNEILIPTHLNYLIALSRDDFGNPCVKVEVFNALTNKEKEDLFANIDLYLTSIGKKEASKTKGIKSVADTISFFKRRSDPTYKGGDIYGQPIYLDLVAKDNLNASEKDLHREINKISQNKAAFKKHVKKLFPNTSIDLGF